MNGETSGFDETSADVFSAPDEGNEWGTFEKADYVFTEEHTNDYCSDLGGWRRRWRGRSNYLRYHFGYLKEQLILQTKLTHLYHHPIKLPSRGAYRYFTLGYRPPSWVDAYFCRLKFHYCILKCGRKVSTHTSTWPLIYPRSLPRGHAKYLVRPTAIAWRWS